MKTILSKEKQLLNEWLGNLDDYNQKCMENM